MHIDSSPDLPTIPQVAVVVLGAVNEDSSSIRDVAGIITQDPPLSAKVLRIANSAFYGLRQPVGSVLQALMVLGMAKIKEVVLSLTVVPAFRMTAQATGFNFSEFWLHSISTALIGRRLARLAFLKTESEIFAAGLLHDIGLIYLSQHHAAELLAACERAVADRTPLTAEEQTSLGIAHPDVGAHLAARWKLPTMLVEAVRYHHRTPSTAVDPTVPRLVSVAESLAESPGGMGIGEEPVPFPESIRARWLELRRLLPKLVPLQPADLEALVREEIGQAREFLKILEQELSEDWALPAGA